MSNRSQYEELLRHFHPYFALFLSTYLQSMFVFDIKNQKYLITANENKRQLSYTYSRYV